MRLKTFFKRSPTSSSSSSSSSAAFPSALFRKMSLKIQEKLPSKGIFVHAYISPTVASWGTCSITLSVPGETAVFQSSSGNQQQLFFSRAIEVEARNIPSLFDKKGRFSFRVDLSLRGGGGGVERKVITEQWIDVNAVTGLATGGTMDSIASTPSIFSWVDPDGTPKRREVVVTYGFYESGPAGQDVLPKRHQCYITVSPAGSRWMQDLIPPGSWQENRRFRRLVLPSAHDSGMNSMSSSTKVLSKMGGAVVGTLVHDNRIMAEIADRLSGPAIALIAPNIIFSLAMTQKDSLDAMLRIGARYFEFRPAYCHGAVRAAMQKGKDGLPDRLYFQHGAVPGMGYDVFLADVVAFLLAHQEEIVVVQLRWDGVPAECAKPSDQDKREYLTKALEKASDRIVVGNENDLRNATIAELRRDKKRLIMMESVDSLSTYTDEGNATLDGQSIVDAFPRVLTENNWKGKAFINIQCQATATNIAKAVAYSVLEAGTTSSCILATKAICDSKTLPWCRDNVLATCGHDTLVVMMNDFIDGATADVAYQISKQRLMA
ncbi:PLC-like phosphodiesterase [Pseudoneurospora amorphoporcata]|uniref:PLC-like phosphodiesterase n=1 Tax=Pseudoneurospora amorphoporcata TaxID=241081 RepID=A0AAN6NKS3_9PEZI|nr:PLC-like phosphodiesterase [Pseudoneurospora amorphoporcata]